MQLSQKTQKIIAIVCGLLLLGVVIAILVNNYRSDTPADSEISSTNTQVTKKTDNSEQTKKAEDPKPVAKPQPEKPAEPSKPVQPPKEAEEPTPKPKPPVTTEKKPSRDFTYIAEPGDSYTVLADRAVQKYAAENKLTITEAQQLQAAATLAANAGSPWLEIGQEIAIQQSDVSVTIQAIAPTKTQKKESKPEISADKDVKKDAPVDYAYTAVAGDSYSTLARRAISEYAASSKLELTPSQRIAAETSIIAAAGFPAINVGQVVTYSGVSIKDAVGAAQMLSEAQLLNWQPYANLAGL